MNISQHDDRQYRLMSQQLDQYQNGVIDFDHLVLGLEALLAVLEAPDRTWADAFRQEWGSLEIVRATRVCQGTKDMSGDPRISEAIDSMRRLLKDRVRSDDSNNDYE